MKGYLCNKPPESSDSGERWRQTNKARASPQHRPIHLQSLDTCDLRTLTDRLPLL